MKHSKRDFLRLMAGGAAVGALPASIRAALAVPAARVSGTLMDVQHVVILMQENRAFDHYLGTLRGVRGFGDPRPVLLPGGSPIWAQPDRNGNRVLPFRLDTATTGAQCLHDIDHSWRASYATWKNRDAWVRTKGPMCMGQFTRADLPFYHALADAFTVCDAYYCSIEGPTNPNRMHLFTGTSGLTVGDGGKQVVSNVDDHNWTADMAKDDPDFAGFSWATYAERLQAAGVSWRLYQEYDNYGDNSLALFAKFRKLDTASPLYQRGRAIVPGSTEANAAASRGEHLVAEFARDVQQGTLPQVSWLVGPYITTEHPEAPPAYGESLTSRLLAVMAANPAVWAKTVFIVNYDENGGFFDHLPGALPPIRRQLGLSTVDTAGEDYGGVPVGLGVRVPMFVVSPWSKGGWVDSQVFDQTSVLRFLAARFGVDEPNISAWRRAVTGDLASTLDFASPDTAWPALPDTSGAMPGADQSCSLQKPTPPATPSLPRQEPGQRPSRALPYRLNVDGRVDALGRCWLDFNNGGSAGAGFTVYSANRTDGPWYYTVEGGRALSDSWNTLSTGGTYAFAVHGPNGFLREVRGNATLARGAAANPELRVNAGAGAAGLQLMLRNAGKAACRVTLKGRAIYGNATPVTVDLAPGAVATVPWPLGGAQRWYDIELTSSSDASYLRRIAGHLDNGQPGMSDPALST